MTTLGDTVAPKRGTACRRVPIRQINQKLHSAFSLFCPSSNYSGGVADGPLRLRLCLKTTFQGECLEMSRHLRQAIRYRELDTAAHAFLRQSAGPKSNFSNSLVVDLQPTVWEQFKRPRDEGRN